MNKLLLGVNITDIIFEEVFNISKAKFLFIEFWKNSSNFFLVGNGIFWKLRDSYSFLSLVIIFSFEINLFLLDDKLLDFSILFFDRYSPTFIILFISLSLLIALFKGL